MKDPRTLAYINLYAILGSLPQLCQLDDEARALIAQDNVSIGFAVKDGPHATLVFSRGTCTLRDGTDGCQVKLPFSSCEKFNGMIDGTVTPIPSKGFTHIGFLTKKFTKLTDILGRYLKADEASLKDEKFFNISTTLMLHVIAGAVAQVANEDKIGRASAGYIVDGTAMLSIVGGPAVGLVCRGHRITVQHERPAESMSYMEFQDMHLARALFDGKVNSVACIGKGQVRVGGMISQVDNINRILDRVAQYLA